MTQAAAVTHDELTSAASVTSSHNYIVEASGGMLAAIIVSQRPVIDEGLDRIVLDVLAAWVEADCSERVEVACCLLHYFLQALNADDAVQELWPGTSESFS